MNYLKQFGVLIYDLFYPKKCIACNKYGSHLCMECAGKIEKVLTSTCPGCGKICRFSTYCKDCKQVNEYVLNGIISAAIYDAGPTKEVIHHLKYSGMIDLYEILAELIYERLLRETVPRNFVIVPVPLFAARYAERGFNQSELIGRYVANKLGIPGADALSRVRNNKPQAELKRKERLENLAGCFRVEDAKFIEGKNVLLVDDVATTGTTLNECAILLKEAGAKKVWGVVVAHG